MSGTRVISTTSRREVSSSFFFVQGKAPREIHAKLTETLACFFRGRAKDLSAPLYLHHENGQIFLWKFRKFLQEQKYLLTFSDVRRVLLQRVGNENWWTFLILLCSISAS